MKIVENSPNKLKSIDSPDKAESDKVCFEENTSTFYLPEKLSDEDILEIIDFCYSRDYSLSQDNKMSCLDRMLKKT